MSIIRDVTSLLETGSLDEITRFATENGFSGIDWEFIAHSYPYKDIKIDGELYLRRFFVSPGRDTDDYTVRRLLHQFFIGDEDRRLHNHPWNWADSVILSGGYTETRLTGFSEDTIHTATIEYVRGDRNTLSGADFHRVASVQPDTWTFFTNGQSVRPWGFLEEGPLMENYGS